jgi:hypothetical protein
MAKNDDLIKQLMAKVAEQKAALGAKPKVSWKTNGVFKFDDNKYLNINIVDAQSLIEAMAYIIRVDGAFKEAAERLGFSSYGGADFNGYTSDEWESDFKLRISILKWEEKKKKLEETERKLAALVSEEARTEMELEKISKLLSGE